MKKPLISFALGSESQDYFENERVIYTGIGKVKAAYNLLKAISNDRPELVINLGSAGSNIFPAKSVVNCTKFIQRDMDCTPLGFAKWVTGFSDEDAILEYGRRIDLDIPEAVCGSGDSFDTSGVSEIYNVVDMESYALAKVCQLENIPFICIKYISDGADGNAGDTWHETVSNSAKALHGVYQRLTFRH